MARIEERTSRSKNRFQLAGSNALDQVYAEKLKSGVGVSLATVLAAAANRKTLNQRQDTLDKAVLTRRQRANAIMSGASVAKEDTNFSSSTSSFSAAAAEVEQPLVKANWEKTEKYDAYAIAAVSGTRDFSKDPAQGSGYGAADGHGFDPEREREERKRVRIERERNARENISRERPLSPMKRTGEDWLAYRRPETVAAVGRGGGGDVGVDGEILHKLPGDKHAQNHDGVHENRARFAGGEVDFDARAAAQETRPREPALAGLRLLGPGAGDDYSAAAAADRAVRAVLHNGRNTASDVRRSQLDWQSAQTKQSSWWVQDLQRRSPDKKTTRAHRPTERPSEHDVPFAVPDTLRTPPRTRISRRSTPSPTGKFPAQSAAALCRACSDGLFVVTGRHTPGGSRRLSPLQKTAPLVLAEFAQNESYLRAKTPWTGGGFRHPRDHDDLMLM